MDMDFEQLIIGGGLAAASAMKELVKVKPDSIIGFIGEENEPPYDRPPLSKGFLQGKTSRDSLYLLRENFLWEKNITSLLGRRAAQVDPEKHSVSTEDGYEIGYEKLLVATGCCLRKLSIPGADLENLHYLRTLPEAEALRRAALKAKQAVIIGGGFIGLEVAASLAQLGLGVTIVHHGDRLFDRFGNEEVSTYYEEMFNSRGVHTIFNDQAVEIGGSDKVENITTKAGRVLPCDIAVAGIGVYPDTAYLASSGIELNNGVVVDEQLRASHPDIYAAGDVANYLDTVYGRQRRIEHWDNAIRQGKLAARNMAGADESYHEVSYFYSVIFDQTLECLGDFSDYDEMIIRGSFEKKSAALFYLKEGVLQSAFMLGRPMERNIIKKLILERRQLETYQSKLADETFALEQALAA